MDDGRAARDRLPRTAMTDRTSGERGKPEQIVAAAEPHNKRPECGIGTRQELVRTKRVNICAVGVILSILMDRTARILVIEDEPKVAEAVRHGLAAQNFDVTTSPTGEDGAARLNAEPFDLLVLDLLLPGREGIEVLRDLRRRGYTLPVLILTARDALEDRVLGLDSGADDYLVKPFALPELAARVRALLRRGSHEAAPRLLCGDLQVDVPARRATRGPDVLSLTVREFELLTYLLQHQGTVVTREMLARDVWQQTRRATPLDNVIDVQVARLRRKVDGPYSMPLIHTVRGMGFVLREGDA